MSRVAQWRGRALPPKEGRPSAPAQIFTYLRKISPRVRRAILTTILVLAIVLTIFWATRPPPERIGFEDHDLDRVDKLRAFRKAREEREKKAREEAEMNGGVHDDEQEEIVPIVREESKPAKPAAPVKQDGLSSEELQEMIKKLSDSKVPVVAPGGLPEVDDTKPAKKIDERTLDADLPKRTGS